MNTETPADHLGEDDMEDSSPQGGRQPVERLWDDEGFRKRVLEVCQLRGIGVRDALIGGGTSPKYMDPAPNGRNTNIIMRIAKFLGVHAAYLMFGPTTAAGPDAPAYEPLVDWSHRAVGASPEQRLALIAQICASYWLHVSINPPAAPNAADHSLQQIATIMRSSPQFDGLPR